MDCYGVAQTAGGMGCAGMGETSWMPVTKCLNRRLLHQARLARGLTREEPADKVGATKSYISEIENDVKEVRLFTLQKIVTIGLGGQVQFLIKIKCIEWIREIKLLLPASVSAGS
jgi:transcriptional regulator with XRE-family HTH domain